MSAEPETLWNQTWRVGGINKKAYFEYFKDKSEAYALAIKNVKRYEDDRELNDYGLKAAPQFFCYL